MGREEPQVEAIYDCYRTVYQFKRMASKFNAISEFETNKKDLNEAALKIAMIATYKGMEIAHKICDKALRTFRGGERYIDTRNQEQGIIYSEEEKSAQLY